MRYCWAEMLGDMQRSCQTVGVPLGIPEARSFGDLGPPAHKVGQHDGEDRDEILLQ